MGDPVFQARLAIENDRYADSEVNRAKTKWQADYGINWSGEDIFVISNSCGQDFAYKMYFTIEMAGANPRLSEYISKAAGYGDKYILGEYYINTSGNMVWTWNPNNLPVR